MVGLEVVSVIESVVVVEEDSVERDLLSGEVREPTRFVFLLGDFRPALSPPVALGLIGSSGAPRAVDRTRSIHEIMISPGGREPLDARENLLAPRRYVT